MIFPQTPAWFWFVIVLVFLNTCTVAVEHYNQPDWLTEWLCKTLWWCWRQRRQWRWWRWWWSGTLHTSWVSHRENIDSEIQILIFQSTVRLSSSASLSLKWVSWKNKEFFREFERQNVDKFNKERTYRCINYLKKSSSCLASNGIEAR